MCTKKRRKRSVSDEGNRIVASGRIHAGRVPDAESLVPSSEAESHACSARQDDLHVQGSFHLTCQLAGDRHVEHEARERGAEDLLTRIRRVARLVLGISTAGGRPV